MTIATLLGLLFAVYVWEWSLSSALIFGLCLSCASTVVLLKALEMHGHLNTVDGQISVGWLVVEDIATVLILVLLPPVAQIMGVTPGGGEAAEPMTASGIAYVIASTLLHVVAFVAIMMVVGRKFIPWVLWQIAKTGSRELFTLSILTASVGIAYGAAAVFDVSFALGAFFAGMVMRESKYDAAVYQVTEDLALVQTVDFFPPMVDDPYIFGQVAAANALSDVYAMGGEVKTALNLVCFPESMDLNVLGQILQGGAEKVAEAGGILAGGHSIADTGVKYGLSVTGLVNPKKLYANDAGQPGDRLILTKALGVGLICSANRVGEVTKEQMDGAVQSMTTLNKTAAEISRKYTVHACTDVTGFGFLGHLHEMMGRGLSCEIDVNHIPVLPGARESADAFLYTAAGQRNRNHVGAAVQFENVPFSMEEVLFDPQTSGGLLMAAAPDEAEKLEQELQNAGLPARIVGTITEPGEVEIFVRG